jgi:hypothetical protein
VHCSDDKGSGARGQCEKADSAFGAWLTYPLFPDPCFARLGMTTGGIAPRPYRML